MLTLALVLLGAGQGEPESAGAQVSRPDLAAISRKVVSARGWHGHLYCWLDSDHILLFTGKVEDGHLMHAGLSHREVREVDVRSRRSHRLERLSALWNLCEPNIISGWVSRDHSAVLWRGSPPPISTATEWVAATLDGRSWARYRGAPEFGVNVSGAVWVPGGRGRSDQSSWLVVGTSDSTRRILVYEYSLETDRIRPVATASLPSDWPAMYHNVDLLGLASQDRLLCVNPDVFGHQGNVGSLTLDLSAKTPAVLSRHISAPSTGRLENIALSPDGQYLAWLYWLDRSSGRFSGYELWASRADGSEPLCVGQLQDSEIPGDAGAVAFQNGLRWTPDSRHLSFLLNEQLYVVGVPIPASQAAKER